MAFVALFDACVLYPAPLRDLLMRLASTGLFRARWSAEIHAEWMNALLRQRPELVGRLERTRVLMDAAVEDCLVTGHMTLCEQLHLPDVNDRHVLAAAIVGRVDVIVTCNIRHFPNEMLAPYGIDAQHPDVFICHTLDLYEPAALAAVRKHRASLTRRPKTVPEYLDMLSRQELPETVAFLRQRTELI